MTIKSILYGLMSLFAGALVMIGVIYYRSLDLIVLHHIFSLEKSDPIFLDAKDRLKVDHSSYIASSGKNLRAILVYASSASCVKFYATVGFAYAKDTPLFCYDNASGEFLRQIE